MKWNVAGLVIFNTIYLLLTLGGLPVGYAVLGAVLMGTAIVTIVRVVAARPAADSEV